MSNAIIIGLSVLAIVVIIVVIILSMKKRKEPYDDQTIEYILGQTQLLNQLYPSQVSLPEAYKNISMYQSLTETIKMFTQQSLERDGIRATNLAVDDKDGSIHVSFTSGDPSAIGYKTQHPMFINAAAQALPGINRCKAEQDCWDNNAKEPFVFFLCLGLPLVNQAASYLLHYPPTSALTRGNYMETFTYKRISRVMGSVGNYPYLPIIDVEPIAANATHAAPFPDPVKYFSDYLYAMMGVLLNPPKNSASSKTLPLVVLGTPARKAWGQFIGKTVNILDTGIIKLPGSSKMTPWIAGNHPNVTTYNCCPNDLCVKCKDNSRDIVAVEKIDLLIACWVYSMTHKPDQDPTEALSYCKNSWYKDQDELACVQAKLDTTFSSNAMCRSPDQALAYCKKNNNNPCANTESCTGEPGGCVKHNDVTETLRSLELL